MAVKRESSANYDTGTGKVQARSETEPERTLTAPDEGSTSRVTQAGETTLTADTTVGPREKAVEASSAENKSVAPRKAARKSR